MASPGVRPSVCRSAHSPELIRAARDLSWVHGTATPGRPATNGVAERAVRSVLEGTRTVLEQAGLPHKFWPYACRHWCFSHNVQTREGNSPWHKRHNKGKFKGRRVPFGSLVDFLPSPIRGGPPKVASRTQPGLFLGYFLLPGGRWKGDVLVASLEDLKAVFDDPNARISVQRVKEITRDSGREPVFPFKAIHERNRSSIENPHQQQLFADVEEIKDGGGSLVEGSTDIQGQTWDPPQFRRNLSELKKLFLLWLKNWTPTSLGFHPMWKEPRVGI